MNNLPLWIQLGIIIFASFGLIVAFLIALWTVCMFADERDYRRMKR